MATSTGGARIAASGYSKSKKTTTFVYRTPDRRIMWTAVEWVKGEILGDVLFVYRDGQLIKENKAA